MQSVAGASAITPAITSTAALPCAVFDVDRLAMCATLDVIGRVAFDIDFKAVQVAASLPA
jgi:hypothetical protein